MKQAIFEFVFLITSSERQLQSPINYLSDGFLNTSLKTENHTLSLITPIKPNYESHSFVYDRQLINNILFEEYVTQITGRLKNFMFIEQKNRQQPVDFPIVIPEKKDSEINDKIEQLILTKIYTITAKKPEPRIKSQFRF